MTTRPPRSMRMRHQREARRSAFAGGASVAGLFGGAGLLAVTQAWWAWTLVGIGLVLLAVFFGLMPRWRSARAQLRHVEGLRVEQQRALEAQVAARQRAFAQPVMRPRFGSF